jgi:8-oxo-dGTP pyrophosphatase MutT (NUDIX family)
MPSLNIQLTEAEITQRLAKAGQVSKNLEYSDFSFPSGLLQGEPRPAAVLIPLLKNNDAWHILFTRRHTGLAEHSGQVAFPGGRYEPDDENLLQTALREAREEIGLDPAQVRILGRLPDYITITNYRVSPFVGVIPWPYPMRIATDEVMRAFTIPLTWLADPANHEERQRDLPPPYEPITVIYFHPYDGEVLWGASARFTLVLLNQLKIMGRS